jgi:NaMN:DMB phosphoribosyltransferase
MMPAVAGVVTGFKESNNTSRVVLAGGTQMAAIFSVIKHLGYNTENISIVTTQYVVNDKTANFEKLTTEMLGVPMDFVDPGYGNSSHPGLRRYEAGDVKEGVGAGGALYLARLMGIPVDDVRKEVERMLEIFASKKTQKQV